MPQWPYRFFLFYFLPVPCKRFIVRLPLSKCEDICYLIQTFTDATHEWLLRCSALALLATTRTGSRSPRFFTETDAVLVIVRPVRTTSFKHDAAQQTFTLKVCILLTVRSGLIHCRFIVKKGKLLQNRTDSATLSPETEMSFLTSIAAPPSVFHG